MFLFLQSSQTLRTRTASQDPTHSTSFRTSLFQQKFSFMMNHNRYKSNQPINDVERSKSYIVSTKNNSNTCMICFDKDLFGCQLHYAPCSHNYCKPCLSSHYKTKILDGEVLNLTCVDPKCDRKISDQEICELMNDVDVQKKFYKFKKNALLRMDKNVIFCCKPNCDGYFYNNKMFYDVCSRLKCDVCNTRMCWQCRQPYHGCLLGCNQSIDVQYYKWALLRDVQECPSCRSKIEKTGGCNHMTCRRCKYQFCWICRGHYSSGHYNWSIKNLLGCPGGQYTWKFMRFPSWTPFWVNRIIMTILLIPILLITGLLALIWELRYGIKCMRKFTVLILVLMFVVSLIAGLQWMGVIDIWLWFSFIK